MKGRSLKIGERLQPEPELEIRPSQRIGRNQNADLVSARIAGRQQPNADQVVAGGKAREEEKEREKNRERPAGPSYSLVSAFFEYEKRDQTAGGNRKPHGVQQDDDGRHLNSSRSKWKWRPPDLEIPNRPPGILTNEVPGTRSREQQPNFSPHD